MGARVYLIKGLGLRRCDVTFSRTFAGGHLGNGRDQDNLEHHILLRLPY